MTVETRETIQNVDFEKIGIAALEAAKAVHDNLGADGAQYRINPTNGEIMRNKYGDPQLEGDYEAEKAVIQALHDTGLPWLILSEEHDDIVTKPGTNPQYLAVLDGMDGSKAYADLQNGNNNYPDINKRYGTMLALAGKIDPTYEEFEFGGVYEHALDKLVYGIRKNSAGERATYVRTKHEFRHIISGEPGTFGVPNELSSLTPGFIIDGFDRFACDDSTVKSTLADVAAPFMRYRSTGSQIVDLAVGAEVPLQQPTTDRTVFEATTFTVEPPRRGNLELASAFPLLVGSGIDIATRIGDSVVPLGKLNFRTWAQQKQGAPLVPVPPVVAATSRRITHKLLAS